MSGELDINRLLFPEREEIIPKGNFTVSGTNVTLPYFRDAEIVTSQKAHYFPLTAQLAFLVIIPFSIVIVNLIVGIAVSDVQVYGSFQLIEAFYTY